MNEFAQYAALDKMKIEVLPHVTILRLSNEIFLTFFVSIIRTSSALSNTLYDQP